MIMISVARISAFHDASLSLAVYLSANEVLTVEVKSFYVSMGLIGIKQIFQDVHDQCL